MGFKDLHLKIKAFRLRHFLIGDGGKKKRESENGKKPSWMVPLSHGYHVVDMYSLQDESSELDSDSVVVQREQIGENIEMWFFGVFDARIGDGVSKYMQSHLFGKKIKESEMRRRSKETLRKAYLGARAKIRETEEPEESSKVGSASAIIINGEKLVIATMGDYRAVVCRDGAIRLAKVRLLGWDSGGAARTKPTKNSQLLVGSQRIDADTEFLILASSGIWEVMKHQEAVNLIRHIDDPQEAAECLAKEALTRMSRSNISCLVIRFD
ncbi:unnamed protein product [Ilex paraguariensis]|uniref:PPM-type phosphatase domain-containing protein n=1 Tax=Ilex paraguariensis TaxID=185542 RepID=A0ABC8TBJ7_9AQUA